MRIIPVIDLKEGVVVRGVAGRRALYGPIESVLGCSSTPTSVAAAFVNQLGFSSVYVADLDAIAGAEPCWNSYLSIASTGIRLLVDAGTSSVERAARFVDTNSTGGWCAGVVVGLESLRSEQAMLALLGEIGPAQAIFSLDLQNGRLLTNLPQWTESEPMVVVDAVVQAGFKRLIVLDLASVGVGRGTTVQNLCTEIRERHPALEITTGGGVRDRSDLAELARAGCHAALVASALHDGSLSKEELAGFT